MWEQINLQVADLGTKLDIMDHSYAETTGIPFGSHGLLQARSLLLPLSWYNSALPLLLRGRHSLPRLPFLALAALLQPPLPGLPWGEVVDFMHCVHCFTDGS